jgi:signal transduction histidine kinase
VVARTLGRLRHSLSGVELDVVLGTEDFTVYADEQKLSDTVVELIKNARTAMADTGGRLTVRTQRQHRGNTHSHVLLSITDNGAGMTPEVMARATDPLFTTGPHGIKAGWGLSNCAGFVRQSGGTMTLTSQPGRGTTVEVSLPLENA